MKLPFKINLLESIDNNLIFSFYSALITKLKILLESIIIYS